MIVEPGFQLWGSERALAATLKALSDAWDRVVLVTPPGAELATEVRAHPDRYGPIEMLQAPIGNLHKRGRAAQLRAMVALAALTLRLRPARVYLNQAGLARVLRPVCYALSIPLALHVRILEDVSRVAALRGTSRTPLDLIFISDAMFEAAEQSALHAVTAWHKAYDPYPLAPQPQALPMEAPFVFVGRLSHGKGPHLLAKALAQPGLSSARADFFGVGVEGEAYAETLNSTAKSLGGRARMMGFQQDVMQLLPAYQFLVSTSQYEALGRVVMEGWEAGLVPIVYAGSGGAAEMVRKSGAGLSFDAWDSDSLAMCLEKALRMPPDTRRAMVISGRDWMARNLGIESYRQALSGILF